MDVSEILWLYLTYPLGKEKKRGGCDSVCHVQADQSYLLLLV